MKILTTSLKRAHEHTVTLSAPNSAAGHLWPMPLSETPGHSWASVGQSLAGSLLFSPGSWCTQGFVCAQESVSLVLCKFWQLYGGVNGDLLQERLCHTQVCCTQSPCPCKATVDPNLHRRHSNTQRQVWLSLCGFPWCAQGSVWDFRASLAVWGLILNTISPLLPSCWGFSSALACGVSFFWWDPIFSCWRLLSSIL